jgi:hypothetical protein
MNSSAMNLPQTYICIASDMGARVFDYYNGAMSEEEERSFEGHLFLCFRCQNTFAELEALFETLERRYEELFEGMKSNLRKPLPGNRVGASRCG